jgi:LDH2 family malate/lactate/ureidoglycolate dehydrogenase
VVANEAITAGMERARAVGVALVSLRNAAHVGRVGAYAERAAAADTIACNCASRSDVLKRFLANARRVRRHNRGTVQNQPGWSAI